MGGQLILWGGKWWLSIKCFLASSSDIISKHPLASVCCALWPDTTLCQGQNNKMKSKQTRNRTSLHWQLARNWWLTYSHNLLLTKADIIHSLEQRWSKLYLVTSVRSKDLSRPSFPLRVLLPDCCDALFGLPTIHIVAYLGGNKSIDHFLCSLSDMCQDCFTTYMYQITDASHWLLFNCLGVDWKDVKVGSG